MADIAHPAVQDGWFRETNKLWPGQAWTLKVDQILHHEKSQYHDILVFDSPQYGSVLVVDNAVQCTERDEFGYRELITHVAMNSHPDPKKVLVIGGGDGGVLREVVKHTSVESATLCNADEAVIRVAKKYLPTMSIGFRHPSVSVNIEDGFQFLRDRVNEFDIIIVDSLDAQGPAEAIFKEQYLKLLNNALKEGGIFAAQVENLWVNLPVLASLRKSCLSIFPQFEYAYTAIPSQLAGQIGMLVCCKDKDRNLKVPLRSWSEEEEEDLCKYYNKDIHTAAFVLPSFVNASMQ